MCNDENLTFAEDGEFFAKRERHCDDCALWDEIDGLKEELLQKEEEVRRLSLELSEYKSAEEKTKKRLLESNMEADRLKQTAQYKYLMELKGLKLFIDKINCFYREELSEEKLAITDLLRDFLKESDGAGYLYKAKDTANTILKEVFPEKALSKEEEEFYGDNTDFNLEEAINPTEELDLKSLLSELGILGEE